jgi:hypothetical protein
LADDCLCRIHNKMRDEQDAVGSFVSGLAGVGSAPVGSRF